MGHDGPYVVLHEGRWQTIEVRHHVTIASAELAPDNSVEISSISDVPGFVIPLRMSYPLAADILPLAKDTALLVVADTHGEYEILVTLLRAQGLIDENCRWAFGNGQAVFIGDMFDRGRHQIEVLWLLYKLETEAELAGGALHIVLGNHDVMVLRGDLRYLHLKYGLTADALHAKDYSNLVGANSVIGAWLRSKPTMLRLGELLFVHGGVSQKLVDTGLDLAQINSIIRGTLDVPQDQSDTLDEQAKMLIGADGPLWYRGYFATDRAPGKKSVSTLLRHFDARTVLVGHTPVKQVAARIGGRVIATHVYPRRDSEGKPLMEAVLRLEGKWYRATAQGERDPLPSVKRKDEAS